MDKKQEFSDLIKTSDELTLIQKGFWGLFLDKANSNEIEAIFEAVSETKENLMLLTEHLRGKLVELNERAD